MPLIIPVWFYGLDSVMYLVSSLIGLLITFYAHKIFQMTKKHNHYFLYAGFLFLSVALLVLSLASGFSYSAFRACGQTLACQLSLFDSVFGMDDFGYLVYFGLSLIGYSMLASAYTDEGNKKKGPNYFFAIVLAFSAIMVLYGIVGSEGLMWYAYHQYFHLVAFLISIFILASCIASSSYKKNLNCALVVIGFSGISAYHLLHFLSYFSAWTYVLAHLSLLTGYLALLAMIMRVKNFWVKK
jgi:hypothetical protein